MSNNSNCRKKNITNLIANIVYFLSCNTRTNIESYWTMWGLFTDPFLKIIPMEDNICYYYMVFQMSSIISIPISLGVSTSLLTLQHKFRATNAFSSFCLACLYYVIQLSATFPYLMQLMNLPKCTHAWKSFRLYLRFAKWICQIYRERITSCPSLNKHLLNHCELLAE